MGTCACGETHQRKLNKRETVLLELEREMELKKLDKRIADKKIALANMDKGIKERERQEGEIQDIVLEKEPQPQLPTSVIIVNGTETKAS